MNSNSFLLKILQNPNSSALSELCSFICTEPGYRDFIESLKNNNSLSFIFLKQYVSSWVESGTMQMLYSEQFVMFLVEGYPTFKKANQFCVSEFVGILSNNWLISQNILILLINSRNWECVEKVFEKYRNLPRSNNLFLEIMKSIESISPVLSELFLIKPKPEGAPSIEAEQENALLTNITPTIINILYSLVYQDIHPFFEDNAEYLFQVFLLLFQKQENKEAINSIFDLFMTKYPEFTDYDSVILALCNMDELDPSLVNTLTKAYGYKRIKRDLIIEMLKKVLIIKDLDNSSEDWLLRTRNILQGNDIERGCAHKLIQLIQPDVYAFEGEVMFFVASVLKYKDSNILEISSKVISSSFVDENGVKKGESSASGFRDFNLGDPLDKLILFTVFRYLISIQEYNSLINLNFFILETDLKFVCMKYISNFMKKFDNYHTKQILSKHLDQVIPNPIKLTDTQLELIFKECLRTSEPISEFAAELLFRITKLSDDHLTLQLYNFINLVFDSINSIFLQAVNFLFDIYISLSIKFKKFNLGIIEYVLNNELTDLYAHCFYYLSVAISQTSINQQFISQILSKEVLFSVSDLHNSLCFIAVSAFKVGIISKDQAMRISEHFKGFTKTIFIYLISKENNILNDSYFQEKIREYARDLECDIRYILTGEFNQQWFIENFLNARLARVIVKKIFKDSTIDKAIAKEVLLKNIKNIEYEGIFHSIIDYFDI